LACCTQYRASPVCCSAKKVRASSNQSCSMKQLQLSFLTKALYPSTSLTKTRFLFAFLSQCLSIFCKFSFGKFWKTSEKPVFLFFFFCSSLFVLGIQTETGNQNYKQKIKTNRNNDFLLGNDYCCCYTHSNKIRAIFTLFRQKNVQ
jgi:hypothetical protein